MNELTPNQKLENFVLNLEKPFQEVAASKSVKFATEAQYALQQLQANKFLFQIARGNPISLKNAIINLSATGLTLNPVSKYAYLVPRNKVVCLDISYMGLIQLAIDTGSILWAQAKLVHEHDDFTMESVGTMPVHSYNPFSKERGEIIGAYCVVKTLEGDFLTESMSIDEIYDIRDASESYKNANARRYSPWSTFPNEMIKKTVIKRASKTWPKTNKVDRLESAIAMLNETEGINFQGENNKANSIIHGDKELFLDPPPLPENETIAGPEFRVLHGKFKDKQLVEIDPPELEEYREGHLLKVKNPKTWQLELANVIGDYLEMIEKGECLDPREFRE